MSFAMLSPVEGNPKRLTMQEAEDMAKFYFAIHNHNATQPQPSIYWERCEDMRFAS